MNRQRKTVGRFPVSIRRMQACDESAFIKTVLPIIIVNANALAGGRMAVATRLVHAPMVAPQPQYRQLPNTRLPLFYINQFRRRVALFRQQQVHTIANWTSDAARYQQFRYIAISLAGLWLARFSDRGRQR